MNANPSRALIAALLLASLQLTAVQANEHALNTAYRDIRHEAITSTDAPKPMDDLLIVGAYDLTWFAIDVYRVQLLAKQKPFLFDANNPAGAFELRINYHIDIKAEKLVEETRKQWKAINLYRPQAEDWLNTLAAMWPNLNEGDQLILSVTDNQHSHFFFNNTWIGDIADPQFGPTFAAIWLDKKAEYPKMRAALLNQNAEHRQ